MCKFPRYRLAVPYSFVRPRDLRGHGYNLNSQAFVFDKRNTDLLEYLVTFYCTDRPVVSLDTLQEIPCGSCMECRIGRSREWAQRCVAESTSFKDNWFVTLTYDDDHAVNIVKQTVSRITGEPGLFTELKLSDLQKFMKDLRSAWSYNYNHEGVRFYAAGEYGETTGRAHFHVILFNCPIPDIELIMTTNVNGSTYSYYHSNKLADVWKNGFITIAPVTWDSCAYVARYVLKKQTGQDEKDYRALCAYHNLEPQEAEFTNMSLRPGIGRSFYELRKDEIYSSDKVVLPNDKTAKPCKYYDKLYDLEEPELLKAVKEARQRKAGLKRVSELKGVIDIPSYESSKHEIFERKIKSKLKRTL